MAREAGLRALQSAIWRKSEFAGFAERDLAREAGLRALRSAIWRGKRVCGLCGARFSAESGFWGFAERDLAREAGLREIFRGIEKICVFAVKCSRETAKTALFAVFFRLIR